MLSRFERWFLCHFQRHCTSPHVVWWFMPSVTTVLMCWRLMPEWLYPWRFLACIRSLRKRKEKAPRPTCGLRSGRNMYLVGCNTQPLKGKRSFCRLNHYILNVQGQKCTFPSRGNFCPLELISRGICLHSWGQFLSLLWPFKIVFKL